MPTGVYTAGAVTASPYAGFWIRVGADLIDTLFMVLVFFLFSWLPIANLFISVLIICLYGGFTESSAAQASFGKRAFGLKVTDLQGQRISFGRAFGRWLVKEIEFITAIGWIGLIVVAFTQKKQGVHDLVCGTLVWRR